MEALELFVKRHKELLATASKELSPEEFSEFLDTAADKVQEAKNDQEEDEDVEDGMDDEEVDDAEDEADKADGE